MKINMKNILRLIGILTLLSIMCGCHKGVTIKSIADLSGKRIGVQAETTGEDILSEHPDVINPTIVPYISYFDAVSDLKHGILDAIVVDYMPATKLMLKYSDLAIVSDTFPPEEYAIAVKKGNTELLDKINSGIDIIRNTGEYTELMNAFMPADGEIILPDSVRITSSKKLRIGTNAAFPPFEYIYKGDIVGFDICIIDMIAMRNNMQPVIMNMDFSKLIGALQDESVDCVIAGMSVTEERAELVDFSKPYFSSHQVIVVKK